MFIEVEKGVYKMFSYFSLVFFSHVDIESANLGPKIFSFTDFCICSLLRFQH